MSTITKKLGHAPAKSVTQTIDNDHTALVHLHKGIPITDSLTIAREFGRNHKDVLRTLDSLTGDGTINGRNFAPVEYIDAKGEARRMIELDERGALVAMPFIGGRKSRQGQVHLVDAFLALRDAQTKTSKAQRIEARREAATSYRAVSAMLQMRREEDGKTTSKHHYSNEARLLSFALTGRFDALDRESLNEDDLRTLTSLEVRDSVLIAMGKSYDERKAALVNYAESLRSKRLKSSARVAIALEVAPHA